MSRFWAESEQALFNPPGGYNYYLKLLTSHRQGKWLDVGCNKAWLASFVSDYVGIDPNSEAIEMAREYWAAKMGWGNQTVLERLKIARAEAIPCEAESFDVVFFKDVLEHSQDPVRALNEAARVLKRGGLLFLSTPDAQGWVWNDPTHLRPYPRKAHRQLASMLRLKIISEGYESVMPGTQHVARVFGNDTPFLLSWVPSISWWPRNVISVMSKV